MKCTGNFIKMRNVLLYFMLMFCYSISVYSNMIMRVVAVMNYDAGFVVFL